MWRKYWTSGHSERLRCALVLLTCSPTQYGLYFKVWIRKEAFALVLQSFIQSCLRSCSAKTISAGKNQNKHIILWIVVNDWKYQVLFYNLYRLIMYSFDSQKYLILIDPFVAIFEVLTNKTFQKLENILNRQPCTKSIQTKIAPISTNLNKFENLMTNTRSRNPKYYRSTKYLPKICINKNPPFRTSYYCKICTFIVLGTNKIQILKIWCIGTLKERILINLPK